MTSLFKKIALLSAGLALGFGGLENKHAQAANFAEYAAFNFSFGNFGSGNLAFGVQDEELDSLKEFLTGVGTEEISLNQLSSTLSEVNFEFNYEGIFHALFVEGISFLGDGTWNQSDSYSAYFRFASGELVGLLLELEPNVSDDSGGYCYINDYSYDYSYDYSFKRCIDLYVSEFNKLYTVGTQFIQELDKYDRYCYSTYYIDESREDTSYCDESSRTETVSGDIEFETVDPFVLPSQSVPEPGSVIGLSLLGLGLLLKKKLGFLRN